ncbi:mechanosensitive ion channel family protein [Candidatus Woesearchaeota archaeon]|nr:mechanosensitive ion channel family protein [Candidatus Woesearchaeota archaeon]
MASFLYQTYFNNTVLQYLIFFAFLAGGFIVSKILVWINNKIIKKLAAKTQTRFDDILLDLLEKPFVIYLTVLFVYIGFQFLKFPDYPKIPAYFGHIIYLCVAVNTAWLFARIIRTLIEEYVAPMASRTKTDLDDTLIPILKKLAVFIIYAIAAIMVLNHFGQDIGALLAGLGIGGLAFALAAKDLLANIFGSVTILTDKPFSIGQRIKINGFDGFVREINVRTTRVETMEGNMLYIPNAKFTDSMLENVSKEKARKIVMNIGVTYDTSNAKMKKAVDIIQKILDTQKSLKEGSLVYFTEFGDSALNILVIYWITDKDNILPIKHDINMKIKEQLEKAKIDMAFPTQTIHVKK